MCVCVCVCVCGAARIPLRKSPCMSRMDLICVTQFCLTSSLGAWMTMRRSEPGVLSIRVNVSGSFSVPRPSSDILLACQTQTRTSLAAAKQHKHKHAHHWLLQANTKHECHWLLLGQKSVKKAPYTL